MYLSVNNKKLCTVKEISEKLSLSRNHLVKIVHNLVRLNYVDSTKGKGGGIRLAISPEKIKISKLILELEPNFNLVECFDKERNSCQIVTICGLKNILNEALNSFLKILENYSLADTIMNTTKLKKIGILN
jgi:Rrf2 family nitric oxide-sensitive transcriptional repressor